MYVIIYDSTLQYFLIKSNPRIEFLSYYNIVCLLLSLFVFHHINHTNPSKTSTWVRYSVYTLHRLNIKIVYWFCYFFTRLRRYMIIYYSTLHYFFRQNKIQELNSSLIIIFPLLLSLFIFIKPIIKTQSLLYIKSSMVSAKIWFDSKEFSNQIKTTNNGILLMT